jgi:hypothetical protein
MGAMWENCVMCFSAEASFGAATGLIPAGAYCLQAAARKNPRLLPIAALPLVFGLQQASEGFVWVGLHHDDPQLTRLASLAFLFPALALWPFWVPFMMWFKEDRPIRRRFLLGLTAASTVWFFVFYVPLVTGPAEMLSTEIVHHSIAYKYPDLPLFQLVPPQVPNIFYGLTVVLPLVLSSDRRSVVPGLAVAVTAILCFVLFQYTFVSVWCFFAAILAAYLVWVFWTLPETEAVAGRKGALSMAQAKFD